MPKRVITLSDVGDITLVKRRGAKNMRLSITATGQTRVSLPYWVPYIVGINFAKSRLEWIQEHLETSRVSPLADGAPIGKSHRLYFVKSDADITSVTIKDGVIKVRTNLPYFEDLVQKKATDGCERALALEANNLLPQRLATLASKHGFSYTDVKVRKLTARWGSCSTDRRITLSYYLIQLPWHLIDYVLLHELVHTKHLNHSKSFWDEMKRILPQTLIVRKEIKQHKPRLEPLI